MRVANIVASCLLRRDTMKAANDHRIVIDDGAVQVNATGTVTFNAAHALLRSAIEHAERHSPKAFLFDCRYSILSMSMADLHSVVASWASHFTRARVAVVLSTTYPARRLAANRAVQAGYNVRVFTNLLDAKDWLTGRRPVPGEGRGGGRKAVAENDPRYALRTVVDLNDELPYWCARFGCTASQLRSAAEAVGLDIKSVEAYLKEQRAQGKR
jgi:hypothetical protein